MRGLRKDKDVNDLLRLDVRPDLAADPWTELRTGVYGDALVLSVGVMREGMPGGSSCVALLVETSDGNLLIARTTLLLAKKAAAYLARAPIVAEVRL